MVLYPAVSYCTVRKVSCPQVRLEVLACGVNDVKLLAAVGRIIGEHRESTKLHPFLAVIDRRDLQHGLASTDRGLLAAAALS
jgi:hypothetical protein